MRVDRERLSEEDEDKEKITDQDIEQERQRRREIGQLHGKGMSFDELDCFPV